MHVGASAWGGMRDVSPAWEFPRARALGPVLHASRPVVSTSSDAVRWQRIILSCVAHAAVLIVTMVLVNETVPLEPMPAASTIALVYAPAEAVATVSPPPIPAAPPVPVTEQIAPPEVPPPPIVARVTPPQPEPAPPIAKVPDVPSVVMAQPTTAAERLPLPPVPPSHPATPRRVAMAPQRVLPPMTETAQPDPQVQPSVAASAAPSVPARPVSGMESDRPPTYPEIARRRGEQGRVLLRVNVSAAGQPVEVDVAQTSGYPTLDAAAQTAVRRWRFVPATQAGTPIAAVADVPVRFRLEN